jgi:integrase
MRAERKLRAGPALEATAKKHGRHSDGGGLYLEADERGARWLWRYTLGGRTRAMGLGAYPAVGLAEAREQRDRWRREALASGLDPITERAAERAPAQKIPTFGELARQYVEKHGGGWNEIHARQWRVTTSTDCAAISSLPIDQIDSAMIEAVLNRVHQRAPETARRLRGRIESVIDEAKVLGHFPMDSYNPASFRRMVPKRTDPVEHHAALPYADVPTLVDELRMVETVGARALELIILTAARVAEVTGMLWSEIDLDTNVWVIPAERMKAGVEHSVPLGDRALEILAEMRSTASSDFVFPGRDGGGVSPRGIFDLLSRRRPGVTVHGFRSSFRDWCGDVADVPREIAEAALAHVVGGVEGAYRRGTALERRRVLMEQWSQWCAGRPPASNVVALRA